MALENVSDVAKGLRMSRYAVYAWIDRGWIPQDAVTHVGGYMSVDSDKVDGLVESGKIRVIRKPRTPKLYRANGIDRSQAGHNRGRPRTPLKKQDYHLVGLRRLRNMAKALAALPL